MNLAARMRKRLTRLLGIKYRRRTRIQISFTLYTPTASSDPALDEVLLIDILDKISEHAMAFHDILSFRLGEVLVNHERILP
jgi:hypothetical protein